MAGIGVSSAPRRIRGSYMPVFTAGLALARSLAAARQNGLWLTSHQEGHLAAGLVSAGGPETARFLLLHLSGGTTELIEVRRGQAGRFDLDLLGGTTDLHAGQFVDRVGVRLGLEFPAGKRLEELAEGASPGAESLLPSSVQGLKVSFSGVESAARRLADRGVSRPDVARAVEGCLARTVGKLIRAGCAQTGLTEVLLVGGVAANKFIRRELSRRLPQTVRLYWAEPAWSRDNAIGVAFLAEQALSPT
ncbi:1-acylglycerophosphocholine O-acyltransferase [Acididesulfobacillus acetoxydans]|uniref:N(6)-L-threonylcarbamoyladenine synthase n=1 Tax=Acididesulfobacillus acetoxydans TaxID=1561005 RepID=A0A8S0Y3J1_9FIRM|nr:1-acylglycerophosphocholine O-acyltransferase [Acididesulfobacillus acetoxydans]CEJ08032.1 Peptidase M22 glycoprotease [Acididesulfobacillus acetoxydans]